MENIPSLPPEADNKPKGKAPAVPKTAAPAAPNVPTTDNSKEASIDQLLQKKEAIPQKSSVNIKNLLANVLKYASLLIVVLLIVFFIISKALMSPTNAILRFVGYPENTYQTHKRLEEKSRNLLLEIGTLKREKRQIESGKSEGLFSEAGQVREILEGEKIEWFDFENEEGKRMYGILDAPKNIKRYFDRQAECVNYDKTCPIIFYANELEITAFNANRENVSVTFVITADNKNVFTLAAEALKTLNAFPIFRDAELTRFSKQEDVVRARMTFSLDLKTQKKDDIDPADENFDTYESRFLTTQKNK